MRFLWVKPPLAVYAAGTHTQAYVYMYTRKGRKVRRKTRLLLAAIENLTVRAKAILCAAEDRGLHLPYGIREFFSFYSDAYYVYISRLPNFFFDLSRLQNRYSLLTFLRFRWGESSGGASFFNEKSPKREYSLDIEQWKRGRLKFLLRLINIKISLKSEREHWKKLGVYEERILPVPEAHSGQIQPAITCRGKWLPDRI